MSLCHFCHDPKSDVLNDDIVGPLSTIENCCVLSHLEKCVCVCVFVFYKKAFFFSGFCNI